MSVFKDLRKFLKPFVNKYRWFSQPEFSRRIKKRDKLMFEEIQNTDGLRTKFYESDPLEKWKNSDFWQIRLINKWNAKEFAKKLGVRVAKFYWNGKFEDFIKFDLDSLPGRFIVKPIDGFSSKNVYIMDNGLNLFDGRQFSNEELTVELSKLYKSIPNLELIIEEFIPDETGSFCVPSDYRFYMFNGHIEFIRLDKRVSKKVEQVLYYAEDWELITEKILDFSNTEDPDPKPKYFEEMKEIAVKLSREYEIFVRVDLYSSLGGPVFGELTATPRAGNGYTHYGSKRLIKAWDNHCRGLI